MSIYGRKVRYITRRAHQTATGAWIPEGTPCYATRDEKDTLTLIFDDGTSLEPGWRFHAEGLEDHRDIVRREDAVFWEALDQAASGDSHG